MKTGRPVITLIAAVTRNGVIGRRGDMPFHIPTDLRFFKAATMGKPIVMGRRTFESLPGGALPGRRNIVVTRGCGHNYPDAEMATSLEDAIGMSRDVDEVMICGGGEIYRQAMPLADKLLITDIDADVADGDTFFPAIDPEIWMIISESEWQTDARSGLSLRFVTYRRRRHGDGIK